jgi:hypothetical protein
MLTRKKEIRHMSRQTDKPTQKEQAANINPETGNAVMGGNAGGTMYAALDADLQQSYANIITLLNYNSATINDQVIACIEGFQSGECDSVFLNNNLSNYVLMAAR